MSGHFVDWIDRALTPTCEGEEHQLEEENRRDSTAAANEEGWTETESDELEERSTKREGPARSNQSMAPSTEGHEVVDRAISVVGSHVLPQVKDGSWICRPYKFEILEQQINENSPGSMRRVAVIGALRDMGVKLFIIDSKSTKDEADVLQHVRRVIALVAEENAVLPAAGGPLGYPRCLLYQDRQGRLFNLTIAQHATGPASLWKDYMESFSLTQAVVALTVLCRSFPCITEGSEMIHSLNPAYLSVIAGLVLTEEIGLAWLNAGMLIRGSPSVSAHSLLERPNSDLLRKAVVLSLALAGAATGTLQNALTLGGIGLACVALLANLGARSWHFLRWKPIAYSGIGASLLAFGTAVATGVVVPFLAHRTTTAGGKPALGSIIGAAFIVAVIFVVSDYDAVQRFLVVGSEHCGQDLVNLIVGIWWFVAFVASMFLAKRVVVDEPLATSHEQLLEEDHASPIGYRVPALPNYELDPFVAEKQGISLLTRCLSVNVMFFGGTALASIAGFGMIYLAFTEWEDKLYDDASDSLQGIL